jgi:methyltransferase family protein
VGDSSQLTFLKQRIPVVDGPVLEIGSRHVNGRTSSFRDFYKGTYIGVDCEAGEGVDVVADLAKTQIACEPIALAICCSVLEHVERPWIMAENITKLLRPGGKLYISVPWVWRYHAYPDDYWRFSWRGVQMLFPDLKWEEPLFSTTRAGELFPAVPNADDQRAMVVEGRKYLPYLMVNMIGEA